MTKSKKPPLAANPTASEISTHRPGESDLALTKTGGGDESGQPFQGRQVKKLGPMGGTRACQFRRRFEEVFRSFNRRIPFLLVNRGGRSDVSTIEGKGLVGGVGGDRPRGG